MKRKHSEKGTVSLEACIVVPVFILIMLVVYGIFVMFMGQQVVTHAVIQSAKSMAFDPYATDRSAKSGQEGLMKMFSDLSQVGNNLFREFWHGEYVSERKWYTEDEASYLQEVAQNRFKVFLAETSGKYNSILDTVGVQGGSNGLDFSNCKVDGGVLTMSVKYTQEFIFNAAGLGTIDREISVQVKLFNYEEVEGNPYEVGFDSGGGKPISNKITPSSDADLPKTTKPGYVFMGWSSTKGSNTVDVKTLEDAKAIGEASNGTANLYAVWEKAPVENFSYGNFRVTSTSDGYITIDLSSDLQKMKDSGLKMKVTVSYTADYTRDYGCVYDRITVGGTSKERYHGKGQDTIFADRWTDVKWSQTVTPQEPIQLKFYTSDSIWEWNAGSFDVKNLQVKVEFV